MKTKTLSFFLSFFLIILFSSNTLQAQVKYTSSGDFGIGTTTPAADFHFKASDPSLYFENSGSSSMYFRFLSNSSNFIGPYIRVYKSTGNLYYGIHSAESSSTSDDKNVFLISNEHGYVNFWPKNTYTYANTFTTYTLGPYQKCYIASYGDQNFFVYGNGHVYHKGITDMSDITLKENIKGISGSIELITQLRPVSYNFKSDSMLDKTEKKLIFGLIAQEVEHIIPEVVSARDDGLKGINYNELTALLIDAVKTQQSDIENLKKQINTLNESVKKGNSLSFEDLATGETTTTLFQNVPNPFSELTRIRYYIDNLHDSGMLNIYDLQGKQICSYPIYQQGEGTIEIPGSSLVPGIYIYNLIVDGEVFGTKQMILTD